MLGVGCLVATVAGCGRRLAHLEEPEPGYSHFLFIDVARAWGVARPDTSDMYTARAISSISSGAAFGDLDGDGRPDLVVNQGPRDGKNVLEDDRMRVYRNTGLGLFDEVSLAIGIDQRLYGSGVAIADYDNDGHLDVFTTNYGTNKLFRNRGDGTFEDVTEAAGLTEHVWGASAAWLDYDNDGLLDLYVVNYLHSSLALEYEYSQSFDPRTPSDYEPWPNLLYRNNGDGTFTNVTDECFCDDPSPAGKSLAVVAADFDEDGWTDLYIANDTVMNTLYRNLGDGKFENISLEAGVALNAEGMTEGSMGIALGDPNRDGLFDLFVTNFATESNTFYLNLGDNVFIDFTRDAGLHEAGIPHVGWGTAFVDFDHDGHEDLIAANGHLVEDWMLFFLGFMAKRLKPAFATFMEGSYKQPVLLYRGLGDGTFELLSPTLQVPIPDVAARGLTVADIDGDGDMDVFIRGKSGYNLLLENRTRKLGTSLKLHLVGTTSNRMGVGARVRLRTSGGEQWRLMHVGGSYMSSHEPVIHFGVPFEETIEQVTVFWPAGEEETFLGLESGLTYRITEGTPEAAVVPPPPPPPAPAR